MKKYMISGFTLIELLVVITIMGYVGLITTQIFFINFRSQGKSDAIKNVKQNGDFALSVMESMIRNAANVDQLSCNSNTQSLSVLNNDGYATTFDCTTDQIASISTTLTSQTSVPLTDSTVTISSCNFRVVCPTPPLYPKYVFINYTVAQDNNSSLPVEQQAVETYQTTVSLRTYD